MAKILIHSSPFIVRMCPELRMCCQVLPALEPEWLWGADFNPGSSDRRGKAAIFGSRGCVVDRPLEMERICSERAFLLVGWGYFL